MNRPPRSKSLWGTLDAVGTFCFFLVISFVGLFAVFVFVAEPLLEHTKPDPTEVVIGFGILSVGLVGIAHVFHRTKSMMWLNFANVSFWLFLYGVVFDVVRWGEGIAPGLHEVADSLSFLAATVVFIFLAHRYRRSRDGACVRTEGEQA